MPKPRRESNQIRYAAADPSSSTTATPPPTLTFTGTGPKISNVVAGMHLNCRFQLDHIARQARNAVYRPKRFPACVLRLREPKATALVFEGGRMQVLGTKSFDDARLAGRKFGRMLQKIGYQPRITDFVVQNMVGNADAKLMIRLEGINERCYGFSRYEPELFPGLIFYLMKPKMTMLMFVSGKVVFLGAKQKEDMDEALRLIWPLLLEFRKVDL